MIVRLFIPSGFALVVLLAGCGRPDQKTEATRPARVLSVGNSIEPATLDPHINTGSAESAILGEIYEPLVQRGEDGLALVPAAAERWEISADGLVYTFHLHRDRRWSNGDKITALDFLHSFRRIVDPKLAAEFAVRGNSVVGVPAYLRGELTDPAQLGFSAPDDHTFVITLATPNVVFIQNLIAYPWVPVHLPTLDATEEMKKQILAESEEKSQKIVEEAKLRIEEERKQAEVALRSHAAALGREMAQQILVENQKTSKGRKSDFENTLTKLKKTNK